MLTRNPIDLAALSAEVQDVHAGAVATFVGVVRAEQDAAGRPLEALEYSAYETMAATALQDLCVAACQRHPLCAVRVIHRLGVLRIGEASVAVAVSSGHRAAAFEACRELIERLKAEVPIFKRELWAGGGKTWVEGV